MLRGIALSAGDRSAGFGLIEFLVALLLFTTGAAGLVSSQVVAQRASHAALQSTFALALAEDFLARIEANPLGIASYVVAHLEAGGRDAPETDCRHSPCTPSELARHDLWQISHLLGAGSGDGAGPRLARLHSPIACVQRSGGEVTVHLSWQVHTAAPALTTVHCARDDGARREVALSAWVAT